MTNTKGHWLRYLLCFALLVVLFFPILDSFADHFPVGKRIMGTQDGQFCLNSEKTQWIKEFEGKDGCVKVDYKVHPDCGKFSEQHRIKNGMSDCQAPKGPTDKELQDQREREQKRIEEKKKAEEQKRIEEKRIEEKKKAEEQKRIEEKRIEEKKKAEEQKRIEEKRIEEKKQYQQPQQQQYQQPQQQQYQQPQQQQYQQQSSNSKINQNDDYVIWGGLVIAGVVVLALIIKKFSKSNNTVNESYGNIPPKDDPSDDDKDDRTDIQKQIDANEEEIRKIDEEITGNNSSSVHNTPPSIDQEDDPVSDDDYQNDEYDNSSSDEYDNSSSDEYDNSSSDEYEEDEGEQWKEDIQERISNNEEKLEELREYSQEIEDDREGGLYENMHDMYEAGRTDDEISQREERIDELNEALDDYDDAGSDDDDYDDDYDDDR